jgi:protein SCO1/2
LTVASPSASVEGSGWCIISRVGEPIGMPPSGGPRGRWRRGDLWLLVIGCAVGTVVAVAVASFASSGPRVAHAPGLRGPAPAAQDAGRAAPAFRLRGAYGELVDERALRGRPFVVTFLYTRCTDACPLIGAELRDALRRLGPRAAGVTVAAITVDPAHDTPAAARAWLRRLREPANVHYLLGRRSRLRALWDGYRVEPQDARYLNDTHSAVLWLADRAGRLRVQYEARQPVAAADLAHDLSVLLAEPTASR